MKVYRERDRIYFSDDALNRLAETNYTDGLWEIVSDVRWTIKRKPNGEPQYLSSGKLRKTLHQVVIDHYFGEEVRKLAYNNGMIIEHLNNDGLDCKISNLYFLLDVKNKYKGNYYDKLVKESLPIVALNVFHIIENHTFQITMAFNEFFKNSQSGKLVHTLKLLYDSDYWTVLQDAESILEYITQNMRFSMEEMKQRYRFKDYRITYSPDIVLTEEEKKLKPGNIIWRDGQPLILHGRGEDYNRFHLISSPYDEDWN